MHLVTNPPVEGTQQQVEERQPGPSSPAEPLRKRRKKGGPEGGKKWQAQISIPSEGGKVNLGTFDSEEEAGIMYARARYKYPVEEPNVT